MISKARTEIGLSVFAGISTVTRKPTLLLNLSPSTKDTLLLSRYAFHLESLPSCGLSDKTTLQQDVAWHNLDENIFASVGDDRQLLMSVHFSYTVPTCFPLLILCFVDR